MLKSQCKKLVSIFIAIAAFTPALALQAAAIPPTPFVAIANGEPNNENSAHATLIDYNGGNKLLYLRHGYNYGGNGNYRCREGNNEFNRSHRYCGDQDTHYKHYAWPYLGLGLGFVYELSQHQEDPHWKAHVRGCPKRHRNYSARPDTLVDHDGIQHRCHLAPKGS